MNQDEEYKQYVKDCEKYNAKPLDRWDLANILDGSGNPFDPTENWYAHWNTLTSPKQEVSEEAKRRTKNLYTPSHKKYIEPKQEESNDLSKVTRLEIIDHSPKGIGRVYIKYDIKSLELSYQDDGRTLKVFIK